MDFGTAICYIFKECLAPLVSWYLFTAFALRGMVLGIAAKPEGLTLWVAPGCGVCNSGDFIVVAHQPR